MTCLSATGCFNARIKCTTNTNNAKFYAARSKGKHDTTESLHFMTASFTSLIIKQSH